MQYPSVKVDHRIEAIINDNENDNPYNYHSQRKVITENKKQIPMVIEKDDQVLETEEKIKTEKILNEIMKVMKVGRMLAESEPFPTINPVGLRSNRRRAHDTP